MNYNLTLKTAPTSEPLSLAEIKDFLKISDFGDSEDVKIEQIFVFTQPVPGTYDGAAVDVLGYIVTVELNVLYVGSGAFNVKVQESLDGISWDDALSFPPITAANDNQIHQLKYTGDKPYIRAVAVVTMGSTCGFSMNAILGSGYAVEDGYLKSLITAARVYCENFQNRAYITQTWELGLPYFPCYEIEIPKGKLQTVESITYKTSTGTVLNLLEGPEFVISTRGVLGRVVPAYGKFFPVFTPFPLDAVVVTFVCGYGSAADVPETVKMAMKLLIGHWFLNREGVTVGSISKPIEFGVSALLGMDRLVIL